MLICEANTEDIKAAFIIHGEIFFGCILALLQELHFIFPARVPLNKFSVELVRQL